MWRWKDAFLRLRALLFRREMDEELQAELQSHLEMQARKNLSAGLTPQEARRQARLQFGGFESAKEECRDARGVNFVETLSRDLRYAFRGFRRTPGFTAVALLALMLGIGSNTAIFSVVYAVLLAPLPYPNPDQLVMVWSKVNGHRNSVSAGDYLDWKRQSTVFQDVGAWSGGNFNLSVSAHPEVVRGRINSPGLLNMQGIRFFMGRDFLPEEGELGKEHVVVMTHKLWSERFRRNPHIVGQQIRLNGESYTVVGVLAAGMADRFESQLVVPLAFKPEQLTHDRHWLLVMGRLKPGVTLQQANAEMDSVTRHIAEIYPASNKAWSASVESLHHDFTGQDTIKGLWLLMGAVGFVLLIACVNVANMLLARGTVRQKEVAIRASLGAKRSQPFTQFLTESLGLALRSFWKMTRVDLGFRQDHVLTFALSVPTTRFSGPEQTVAFYRQLLDKIQALPGVSYASASTGMPVLGTDFGMSFSIAGQPAGDPSSRPGAGFTMVTPEYFDTFGIEIVRGRSFTEQDVAGALPVAIVNETFARKYLSNVDPLMQRVLVQRLVPGATSLGPPIEWQVVGVYRDVHNAGVRREGFPEINVPFWQSPWPDAAIEVRTSGHPASMTGSVAAVVQSVDPDLGIDRVRTMDELVEESLGGDRFATVFLATFAGMALLLAAIGIYGVMSFAVAQRTHEMGLRIALGAGRAQVLRLILQEGVSLAILGLFVGLCGTYFVGRLMKSLLYEVGATDPATIGAVTTVLLASALLASCLPAHRATQVDPMVVLRNE